MCQCIKVTEEVIGVGVGPRGGVTPLFFVGLSSLRSVRRFTYTLYVFRGGTMGGDVRRSRHGQGRGNHGQAIHNGRHTRSQQHTTPSQMS